MTCLWCDKELILETTWSNLFLPSEKQYLCEKCGSQLELLTGQRCRRCSRITEEIVCSDCQTWESRGDDPLCLNHSVFAYNERMQEMIAKWKYRGDYILGQAFQKSFLRSFKKKFRQHKKYEVIPIPLSKERIKERGFNQAEMLASFITPNYQQLLTRVHGEKQSKKTRKERMDAKNPFKLTKALNNPVILVDDIYTTGTTLRFAADVLKQSGCPIVYGYTLIRG